MPWKDESQPASKPRADAGPWDVPNAEPAPTGAVARPDRARAASEPGPWSGGDETKEPAPKPRMIRRPRPVDRPPRPTPSPSAPPRRGPDLDELKRQLSARLATFCSDARSRRLRLPIVMGAAAIVALAWAASGVYRVEPGAVAVVQRFGAFAGEASTGLHYRLPWPLETARQVPLGTNRLDGGGTGGAGRLLSADGEEADLAYSIDWKVADARRYLFHAADAPAILRTLAASAMGEAVGRTLLKTVLEPDHALLQARAGGLLQRALDRYGAGVTVVGVVVRSAEPPDEAQAAAHDVATAAEDAVATKADADAYRAKTMAAAKGDAAKALEEAKGAGAQEVAEAKGEADRFALIDAQYRKAPDVTRERLYTEMMQRVLHVTPKVILDTPKGVTVVLPESMFRAQATQPAPAAPTPSPSTPATPAPADGAAAQPAATT